MSRSLKKGPYVDVSLIKAVDKMYNSEKKGIIKTWKRSSTITPQFVGLKFAVYNGKKFIPVNVVEDMIGQKLGEYSPTRTYYGHGADKKAKRG